MARLRYNNSVGTLGASLTSSGTTIAFASAPSFATIVSPDYIAIVLEPTGSTPSANFEIVYLTAYTAAATTGTILRGQEGTTGVAHSNGVAWEQGPVQADAYENYAVFTSSGSWIVPAGVTEVRMRVIGGGSGGGGGVVGAANSPGGAGGGGGTVGDQVIAVTPGHSLTITIGAGGTAGAAAGYGGAGGTTTVADSSTTLMKALGPSGGAPGASNCAAGAYGASTVRAPWGNTMPGCGGPGSAAANNPTGDVMICVVGGICGGSGNATNGGAGGGAQLSGTALVGAIAGPGIGGSGTINGVAGTTATQPGCGGGGGGGAVTGATAASGGAGAPGGVEIWW